MSFRRTYHPSIFLYNHPLDIQKSESIKHSDGPNMVRSAMEEDIAVGLRLEVAVIYPTSREVPLPALVP